MTRSFCRDRQKGGTRLVVNDSGVTCCLLNAYSPDGRSITGEKRSRGDIPLLLSSAADRREVASLVEETDWGAYPPCELHLFFPNDDVFSLLWDGRMLKRLNLVRDFATSSSVRSVDVSKIRKARFDFLRGKVPLVEILNDREAVRPEEAIWVNREDGGTVSQTVIQVTHREVYHRFRHRGQDDWEEIKFQTGSNGNLEV